MKKNLVISVLMTMATTVLLGIIYPLVVTGLSQLLFPQKANGQLIAANRKVVGSRIIGQAFSSPGYFHSRPSAAGNGYDATATREKAFNHPSASPTDLHLYARTLLNKKKKDEAIKVWQLNAKLHPNVWPVNVGLMRANSASGNYKEAAKYAKLALAQVPDEANKKSLEGALKKLEAGQDVN